MIKTNLWISKFMKNGPEAIDEAINKGIELDGSKIPEEKLNLYKKVKYLESQRERHRAADCMRTRIVRSANNYFTLEELNRELKNAGWKTLNEKEEKFFFNK